MDNRFSGHSFNGQTTITLDLGKRSPFLSVNIDDIFRLQLWSRLTDHISPFEITATQLTLLNINSVDKAPLNLFLKTIDEFSLFLSIALFSDQQPNEVFFVDSNNKTQYTLLFEEHPSTKPDSLIKFDELREKIPDLLKKWHLSFEKISPITHYLIRYISRCHAFDTPDFLTIAYSLDGYFKRFINRTDGKDIKQYKLEIEKLLKKFQEIDVVQDCKLDAEILTQTRHKYSHLIPDEDPMISKAVMEGEPLFLLTQQCVVLLTCCILDMLGLTTKEMNLCCNNSPLKQIINSFPLWFHYTD